MPQVVVPSPCFLRKGHLKRISQQAPQRLQSPRRRERASMTSSFLKRMRTKRRSLPCAWRARNLLARAELGVGDGLGALRGEPPLERAALPCGATGGCVSHLSRLIPAHARAAPGVPPRKG
jgi:hypothetical protein